MREKRERSELFSVLKSDLSIIQMAKQEVPSSGLSFVIFHIYFPFFHEKFVVPIAINEILTALFFHNSFESDKYTYDTMIGQFHPKVNRPITYITKISYKLMYCSSVYYAKMRFATVF